MVKGKIILYIKRPFSPTVIKHLVTRPKASGNYIHQWGNEVIGVIPKRNFELAAGLFNGAQREPI
jgi:hypothetical protein